MEMTVSRKNFCDYDANRTVAEIVYEAVMFFRNRGHRGNTPFEHASLALGISRRKTWSIFYGQAFMVMPSEHKSIRERFVAHLDQQAEDLARRSEAARARRRQIELEI